ncbi:hypothetical protein [Streptomyces sp. NPDC005953]|uniref:hypothetical protein n=1 Tax=unclassified Streptomyces TaxID=2593676 RepID=UPI0033E2621B
MRTRTKIRRGRTARTAWAVVALALITGCSSGGDGDRRGDGDSAPSRRASSPAPAVGTLEQLAARASCTPNVQTDAEELRQANCTTSDGRYVLTTFATDRGLHEWITEAKDYGGTYLVGRRWVAVGDEKVITALRGRLGGTVESGSLHHSGGSGGSGGGGSDDHSDHGS